MTDWRTEARNDRRSVASGPSMRRALTKGEMEKERTCSRLLPLRLEMSITEAMRPE